MSIGIYDSPTTGTGLLPPAERRLEQLLRLIAERVELPPSAHEAVRRHYAALTRYLAEGRLAQFEPSLYAQGSYRLGTTAKPIPRDEFDLDFVIEILLSPTVEATAVFEMVAREIEANGHYSGKVERRDRCIRINLAGGFHTDIVPAIPDPVGAILIPSRNDRGLVWRHTDPKGYVAWFELMSSRDVLAKRAKEIEPLPPARSPADKTPLQATVQLVKRHHHVNVQDERLRTPSIVLTTIVAAAGAGSTTLVQAMDLAAASLLGYARSPQHVLHPTTPNEVLTEKWNDARILRPFQTQAELFAAQWKMLRESQGAGFDAIGQQLGQMFGEDQAKGALKQLGEDTQRLRDSREIAAAAGGALISVSPGRGDPPHTFHGD